MWIDSETSSCPSSIVYYGSKSLHYFLGNENYAYVTSFTCSQNSYYSFSPSKCDNKKLYLIFYEAETVFELFVFCSAQSVMNFFHLISSAIYISFLVF